MEFTHLVGLRIGAATELTYSVKHVELVEPVSRTINII